MDDAAAAVAVHLGEADEEKINNMSFVWFNRCLEALGKKLNYESISNIYGNSFAKDASKIVQKAYPLTNSKAASGLGAMIGMANMKIIDAGGKDSSRENKMKELGKALGGADTSWFEEFLK